MVWSAPVMPVLYMVGGARNPTLVPLPESLMRCGLHGVRNRGAVNSLSLEPLFDFEVPGRILLPIAAGTSNQRHRPGHIRADRPPPCRVLSGSRIPIAPPMSDLSLT